MDDILVKIEDKRGYYSITYFKARNIEEYESNKSVLGYYDIQKDVIDNANVESFKCRTSMMARVSPQSLVFKI